ncbi:MAG: RIP metalloprotease RseP [Enterobacterales bacterium]|nr:RIP metalloprotease RseP [Enterobacterales bacterium]
MTGITGVLPELGYIPENSIVQKAGLESGDIIVKVDGESIQTMHDLSKAIAIRLGERSKMKLEVITHSNDIPKAITLNLNNWTLDDENPQILHSLGFYHPLERTVAEVGSVVAGGPAEKAGILVGDTIKEIDAIAVDSWQTLKPLVESRANQRVMFKVERKGELIPISVVIGSADKNKPSKGKIGIGGILMDRSKYRVKQQAGLFESFGLAVKETANMIDLSLKMFSKLISGEISTKSLSGPISIAEGAGASASYGLNYLIRFMAMISVNLGFINLLPIPMLDGGHLLYFVVEAIKGKPLSEKMQEFGLQIGMMLVFTLMAVAIYNDLWRFF